MKRVCCLVVILSVFLSACGGAGIEPGMQLREQLTQSNGCKFTAEISADYGDQLYSFIVECQSDTAGSIIFLVKEPETISGIGGKISVDGGAFCFDEHILAFPLLADGQISPISTPWLLIRLLLSGYITHGGSDGDAYMLHIDDSYAERNIGADIWLNDHCVPIHADFIWNGRRFLTMCVKDFQIL